jgi:PPR repeat
MAQDDGCWRMTPDTLSFNIAIAALAQGKERDSGSRAETLLDKMEDLSKTVGWDCAPDQISFNSVINNWASSKSPGAAERAVDIMDHMIKRYEAGVSAVCVDEITFSVVLKALAKSKDRDSLDRAEEVFEGYRKAVEEGRWGLTHSALTWNSMINCYAKSLRRDAGKKAMELFKTMRLNAGKPEWERCFVDKYTYTSLIDAIAKEETYEASEKAIGLLEEVEKKYEETENILLEPNILLYTAVVNAIGRSHKDPDRAQTIVDRVERRFLQEAKGRAPRPDVLFYNALINAYGWSEMEGRSAKSFKVLQHMCDLFQSGEILDAKPDIISYNSVLNACAHEQTKSQSDSDGIMKLVTELYEDLTSTNKGRGFARPNQNTYVQVLIAISNHMPADSDKRSLMGQAVFFKCAEDGLVYPQTITVLNQILPNSIFQSIMGDSLDRELHNAGKLRFDMTELPWEWTANVRGRSNTLPSSRKVKRGLQVTKNVLSKMPRRRKNDYQ